MLDSEGGAAEPGGTMATAPGAARPRMDLERYAEARRRIFGEMKPAATGGRARGKKVRGAAMGPMGPNLLFSDNFFKLL